MSASDGSPPTDRELAEATDARSSRLHRLGNLTVVARPLNPAMSNSAWTVKRTELNKHSVLLMNSELAQRDTWDEQAIDERGERLAAHLVKIWPGPNTESWTCRSLA